MPTKPRTAYIRLKWTKQAGKDVVNWALIGANNELVCSSNQGFANRAAALLACKRATQLLGDGLPVHMTPKVKPKAVANIPATVARAIIDRQAEKP